jgi:hypothetical protein
MGGAIEGLALFAFPFVLPLPFLFLGCIGALAFIAKARNPVSVATLALATAIAAAAVHALMS